MVRFSSPRTRHPFHMYDMIRGQPAFVRETLERRGAADLRPFLGPRRDLIVTGLRALSERSMRTTLRTGCNRRAARRSSA